MKNYTYKNRTVQALQWTGDIDDLSYLILLGICPIYRQGSLNFSISTRDEILDVSDSDWIIWDVDGSWYTCPDEQFQSSFMKGV